MNPLDNMQYDLKTNHASDILSAKQLADQAIQDPSTRHEYFDFLKNLREKKGPEYSTAVHQYASKLLKTKRPDIYPVEETIVKTDGEYELKSKSGKNLGKYPTRAGAEKREQQVNYFKHANEGAVDEAVVPGGEGTRPGGWPTIIDNNGTKLYNLVARFMQDQASKYQKYVVDSDSIPAAPNTGRFLASRGGMIEYAKDTELHGGHYGFNRFCQNFMKIGGNVDYKIKEKMKAEFKQWLAKTVGGDDHIYVTTDGYEIMFCESSGTNWGGYGLAFKKLSDSQIEYYKKSMTSAATESIAEDSNPTDAVTVDVPLLIRLLEYAREDANTDMDLHNIAEKLIELSAQGNTLTMQDYNTIVGTN